MIRSSRRDERTDHNYYKDRLSAYLDDELAARERRAVEQHLKTCEACRWELATLKQTVAWLAELPTVPVPRMFTIPANVVPAPPVRRPRRSFVPVMQFATALVAVLLFFAAAGDVMLTGWPWGAAQPAMREVAPEQPVTERAVAKDAQSTREGEVATYAEPYGGGDAAATGAAAAQPTTLVGAEAAGAAAAEEAPMMQQAAPAASAAEPAEAQPAAEATEPAVAGAVGGEGSGDQEQAVQQGTEEVAGVQADTPPVLASVPAQTELPADTPAAGPMNAPEPMGTPAPTPLVAATTVPQAFVPTPTAVPTIHPPATDALEPPMALVQAPEPVPAEAHDEAEQAALRGGETDWAVFWLRVVEYVLGVALVVLTAATILLMAVRRRAQRR